ncbi:MAG: CbiX/SirB N-terminal domain-containing protein [Nitrospinae bacterium]|nr:CbiX/SirB N-terminal domain-containing protein [Nitrospinota bacterium]
MADRKNEKQGGAKGLILFAHGSRDPRWKEPFEKLERMLSGQLKEVAVRVAYLQDCPPDIFSAAEEMARNGAAKVTVIPMFLAVGSHSANDFPKIAGRVAASLPQVEFTWTDVIGQWEETLSALAMLIGGRING